MVSLASLDVRELGRCVVAGLTAGAVVGGAIAGVVRFMPAPSRMANAVLLLAGSGMWALVTGLVLDRTGSALPRVAMKRLGWRG